MSQLLFEQKRSARNTAIDELVAKSTAAGGCTDRLYWTIVYDCEHAPMTTNLAQLAEVGVNPTPSAHLTDEESTAQLWVVINTLADLGIYFLNTNHLTDRALYERLVTGILLEPVRDLPPDAGVHEFIDLTGGSQESQPTVAVSDRDSRLPRPKAHSTSGSEQHATTTEGDPHES